MMVTVTKWTMNCVHDLHLKPVSHSVAVSIQKMASQLTDELLVYIVYNKVTVKNMDNQSVLTKQEEWD